MRASGEMQHFLSIHSMSVPWRGYLQLCKPRVVGLIVFTGMVGLLLAEPAAVSPGLLIWSTLGIGLAAASAAAINHVADHRIDALMARTRHRPIPQGEISRGQALVFAAALCGASMGILIGFVNVLTAVLTSALPALLMARTNLVEALQASSRGSSTGKGQRSLRHALMISELALSVILLVAAGLLLRSFSQLLDTPTGFRRGPMLTLHVDPPFTKYNLPEQTALFYREAQSRLGAVPGVEAVAANHSLPFVGNENYGKPSIVLEGQSEHEQLRNPFVNVQIVSPNYLSVMGIPLLKGRDFDDGDRLESPLVAVVSRPLARQLFGETSPLHRRFRFVGLLGTTYTKQDAWFTIVGVADGVRSQGLLTSPGMDVYLSNQQQFVGDTFFVLRTGYNGASLGPALPRIFQQIDPEQAIFDIATMEERIQNTVWQRRLASSISFCFGVLALFLATIGAYGVLSYSVSQRTREMGVRLALGCTPRGVLRLVVGQGMSLALLGVAVGMVGAVALATLIRHLLPGITFLDPLTFALVALTLLAASLLACYIPARRAASVDPIAALRYE